MTIFKLTRNGEPIHSIELTRSRVRGESWVDVNEMQRYGFEIEGREQDIEYMIRLGDVAADSSAQLSSIAHGSGQGIARGRFVLWDDSDYFQGARGVVFVRLESRAEGSHEQWQERAELPVVVSSTKLSEDRYHAMYEQLRSLASGLVLDLVSKSLRSIRLGGSTVPLSCRSSIVDLRILERLWPPIAASLNEIASNPVQKLVSTSVRKPCFGSERFGARSLARMAAAGSDPRRVCQSVPFVAEVQQIVESNDTLEHRVIRGFLEFLERRVTECRNNLNRHMAGIAKDRCWRERQAPGRLSLYQTEDVPRLLRLREQLQRTERLRRQLQNAQRITPIREAKSVFRIADTPVFRNVASYRRIQHEMVRYLTTGLVVIDEGYDERIKSTAKMYEQWVFLQLAAAIRSLGLPCRSRNGLLHTSQVFRFTLDIDRGARVTFDAGGGRAVSLRYEPWILPAESAKQSMETVFRGRSGQSSWSPDVLLEILRTDESADMPGDVEYALVIDAKYTSEIRDHHWENTDKYLEIRSTRTKRQAVRQLWLVYPGEGDGNAISMRDSTLQWTEAGPNCRKDETVRGVLSLIPPVNVSKAEQETGWITGPEPVAVAFMSGLLDYLNIPHESVTSSESQMRDLLTDEQA